MKVVATNIGKAVEIEWNGKKEMTGMYKYPVDEPILLGLEDVEKDDVMDRKYHGGLEKACYLYSADHYSYWQKKYPATEMGWGFFGENITVEGLNESAIRIGDNYRIGEALVQVTQPRQPCYKLGIRAGAPEIVRDFWNSPFPGVYLRVLEPGSVRTGDTMQLVEQGTEALSLADVFALFTSERNNIPKLRQAIAIPEMAASCRKDLTKRLRHAEENQA